MTSRIARGSWFAWLAFALLCAAERANAQLPSVRVPLQNPITPEKAVLGKILFWEEQLSSDNTVACGTCHVPSAGGTDPRSLRHAGPDGLFHTDDDKLGSPGVRRVDAGLRYRRDPMFGVGVQATRRKASAAIGAQYFDRLFWDGRAETLFRDPLTGNTIIGGGGALENQALGPILSDVEMAFEGRTWAVVTGKLARVRPLALATNLPPDVRAALASSPDYPALFRAAFGDPAIDPVRIAFAIATYERTLVPDRTPWDRFMAGDASALTVPQQRGFDVFLHAGSCHRCHSPGLFSDGVFRNVGLRPIPEDRGRQEVTGLYGDGARFKVPTLRNVGLHTTYFHDGRAATLADVVEFYDRGGDFLENLDVFMFPLGLSSEQKSDLVDFMQNALTDPRVAIESAPFDRPTLYSETHPDGANLYGATAPGSGGVAPEMIAACPANLGNQEFLIGVAGGLGGATAWLMFSDRAAPPGTTVLGVPLHVALPSALGPFARVLDGSGPGAGTSTVSLRIPDDVSLRGLRLFAQWFVADPQAAAGFAASRGARIEVL